MVSKPKSLLGTPTIIIRCQFFNVLSLITKSLLNITIVLLSTAFYNLAADNLPNEITVKMITLIAKSAKSDNKILVKDSAMKDELAKVGYSNDDSASIAWAASINEVKSMKKAGKLVMCGNLDWLSEGGCVAFIEESGRPQIYLHLGNINSSGVHLSDSILKVGKKFEH